MATNLNPATASFTTTNMILGNEVFSQTAQNNMAENGGYCLYAPRLLNDSDETMEGNGTYTKVAYMAAGTYLAIARSYRSAGTVEVTVNGTTVLSGAAAGANVGSATVAVASDGFYNVSYTLTGAPTEGTYSNSSVWLRQYAE